MNQTFVLVPGAGGVAAFWRPVVAELDRLGHRAVAVDLPGDDETAGLPEYVDLILAAAPRDADVVVVGQSMGAFPAVVAAARLPAHRIVLVNPMIPVPGETPDAWGEATGSSEARRRNEIRDGRDPDAPFDMDTVFLHDVPPDLAAEVMSTSRNEAQVAFAQPWPLDAWPDLPTRVVLGADDRLFPLDFQLRVTRARLGIEPVVVPGGHLAALSHPAEVAAALL